MAEFLQRFTVTGRAHSAEDDAPSYKLSDIFKPRYSYNFSYSTLASSQDC